jgi:hypothetical protein
MDWMNKLGTTSCKWVSSVGHDTIKFGDDDDGQFPNVAHGRGV